MTELLIMGLQARLWAIIVRTVDNSLPGFSELFIVRTVDNSLPDLLLNLFMSELLIIASRAPLSH